MYRIYEIKNGDTLESIASRLGISAEVLANLNGLNVNTSLIPNSFIVIPSGNSLFDRYLIEKGDNVYEIARKYGINPKELLKLNGLNENDIIYAGEELLVPKENTGFYVTENEDTIEKITNALNIPFEEIMRTNRTIYLLPDQLIVYKK